MVEYFLGHGCGLNVGVRGSRGGKETAGCSAWASGCLMAAVTQTGAWEEGLVSGKAAFVLGVLS